MTKEGLAIFKAIRNIPSLRNVPDNMLITYLVIAAGLAVFLFIMLWFLTGDRGKTEHKQHDAPETHKMIMDLQKTLINELKGTSKQNKTMINLTILFIALSFVGIVASIIGGEKFMIFVRMIMARMSDLTNGIR